jgi:hypothetical protein
MSSGGRSVRETRCLVSIGKVAEVRSPLVVLLVDKGMFKGRTGAMLRG